MLLNGGIVCTETGRCIYDVMQINEMNENDINHMNVAWSWGLHTVPLMNLHKVIQS